MIFFWRVSPLRMGPGRAPPRRTGPGRAHMGPYGPIRARAHMGSYKPMWALMGPRGIFFWLIVTRLVVLRFLWKSA